MEKAIVALFAAFTALLPRAGEKRVTGKPGRPSQANPEKFLSNYAQRLPLEARALLESNPALALDMLNAKRRNVTEEEADFLDETADGTFQGMRNGEPVQTESRASFNVMVQDDETLGQAVIATFEVALVAAKAMAKRAGTAHYIHFERWAIARDVRGGRKLLGKMESDSLLNLPARYQGVIYVTNSTEKQGFLSLGEVSEMGKVAVYSKVVKG